MYMNLVDLFKKAKIIKFGSYTLTSGIQSHYYCDVKEVLGDSVLLRKVISELVKIIPKQATCIAGMGYGGISLASLVAFNLKLPIVMVRDKPREHGTKKTIDGYITRNKVVVCVVDDVFTTGSSIRNIKSKLLHTKTKFTKSVVVLNRSNFANTKEVVSLITDKDIVI